MSSDLPSPDDFSFHREIEVRFRDLDAMGHVNNAAYLTYFEIGRTGYMVALGHCQKQNPTPAELFPFVVLDVTCRYLAPVGLEQRLTLHLRTSRIGNKSFEFEYLLTDADTQVAAAWGRSTQVYYDYATSATQPVPQHLRACIEKLEGHPA
ncbi:acyl-CoA thioesterase [Myxococcota bacterium]